MAIFHMEGKVIPWFQKLEDSGAITNWKAFIRALHVRFGETTYDDPMETLTKLRQVSTVEAYKTSLRLFQTEYASGAMR